MIRALLADVGIWTLVLALLWLPCRPDGAGGLSDGPRPRCFGSPFGCWASPAFMCSSCTLPLAPLLLSRSAGPTVPSRTRWPTPISPLASWASPASGIDIATICWRPWSLLEAGSLPMVLAMWCVVGGQQQRTIQCRFSALHRLVEPFVGTAFALAQPERALQVALISDPPIP